MKNKAPEKECTVLVDDDKHGPIYIKCNSQDEFVMPSLDISETDHEEKMMPQPEHKHHSDCKSPSEINASLNKNLGLSFILNPMNPFVRKLFRLLGSFVHIFDLHIFRAWDAVPLRLRQKITTIAWALYFHVHRFTLGRLTGIHRNASPEYHAITSICYWGNFFPVSIRQMRFCLSQLNVTHAPNAYPKSMPLQNSSNVPSKKFQAKIDLMKRTSRSVLGYKGGFVPVEKQYVGMSAIVFEIHFGMHHKTKLTEPRGINSEKCEESLVTGYYVQHGHEPSTKVILWLYGGAYLGGDSKGNLNIAEKMCQRCDHTDVFIPNYRLMPEYHFLDALHDVIQAYEYLVTVREVDPKDIILFGISSGGGLVMRLLQTIAEKRKEVHDLDTLSEMPAGAVLMCPFVDYTKPKGTFVEYREHDLIVNQSVCEVGVPYLKMLGGDKEQFEESPVNRIMEGLPPICLVISEHECCYDMAITLCNRARAAGVNVTLGVWKYMCHVFPMFSAFVPEGRQAVDFMCQWMNDHLNLNQN